MKQQELFPDDDEEEIDWSSAWKELDTIAWVGMLILFIVLWTIW